MNAIKTVPEDFIVEEIPLLQFQETGGYAVLKVTKRNLTTEDALSIIAAQLHKQRKDLSCAGNKDKQAITTQYVSVKAAAVADVARIQHDALHVELAGFLDRPLSLGLLAGNRFTIRIRDCPSLKEVTQFVNYFDEQRFSRDNVDVGMLLLKKQFRQATEKVRWNDMYRYLDDHPTDAVGALQRVPPKMLSIYIHAVQSLLWNELAAQLVRQHKHHDIAYSQGLLAIPDEILPQTTIPLFGYNVDCTPELRTLYLQVLLQHGLQEDDFLIRQLPHLTSVGADRPFIVDIADFSWERAAADVILCFSLPKGSYATMLLKHALYTG